MLTFSMQLVRAYENTEHGFSINFPSGWEQSQNQDVVVLYTNDDGSASINVIVEETSLSLAAYATESKNQLENLDYYELITENSRTINGLNGYELVFAWTLFTDNETYYDLQDKQVFFVQNGKAFIITCGADYSDYDLFLPTFEQSLETFRLTSSGTPGIGMPDTTLIIILAVVIVVVVLAISMVLLRRRRKPTQQQSVAAETGTFYPPPPPPPPP